MLEDYVLDLDSLFGDGLGQMINGDTQMLDVTHQASDWMTSGGVGFVPGTAAFGQEPSFGNDIDPGAYSSFDSDIPFNNATTALDAGWHPALTQRPLHSSPSDTHRPTNGLSDFVHSNLAAITDSRPNDSLNASTAFLAPRHLNTESDETYINKAVMLDASPSLTVVENERMTNDSYTHRGPLFLPCRKNFSTDVAFVEGPQACKSFAKACGISQHDTDAQILAYCGRPVYATAEDWERYRPEISKLYYNDNKTLGEVQATMKTQYGFNATYARLIPYAWPRKLMTYSRINMYKKRISKWELHKNCKTAEKEAILRCMDTHEDLGIDLGQPMLNGKPVRMHVLHRHRKEKQKGDRLASEKDHVDQEVLSDSCHSSKRKSFATVNSVTDSSANAKRARMQRQASTISVSFSRIADPADYRNTQDLLVQLDHYIDAKLDGNPYTALEAWEKSSILPRGGIQISYTFQNKALVCRFDDDNDIFQGFGVVATCLDNGQVRSAWKLANKSAAMVLPCLQRQHPEFLRRLLYHISTKNMGNYPEICAQLIRQFSDVAAIILGQNHPVTKVCRLLQFFAKDQDIVILSMRKTLHAFERRLGSDHRICFNALDKICRTLLKYGRHNEAELVVQQLSKTYDELRGRNDYNSRERCYRLAGLYYDLGKYDEAEAIIIDLTERGLERGHLDIVNDSANELRGMLYEVRGHLDTAESFAWIVLSSSLLRWGQQHSWTTWRWIYLQKLRRMQRKGEDTADTQDERLKLLCANAEEPFRCFSRPRSWSFPLEEPALRTATWNVEGRRGNRSRKRDDGFSLLKMISDSLI
jgi:hypothetical protein